MKRTSIFCTVAFLLPIVVAVYLVNLNQSGDYALVNLPEPAANLFSSDKVELISLSPRDRRNPPDHFFHGFEPLGSITISNRQMLERMAMALDQAVGKNAIENARCFWPRHGLRAVHDGKTIEILICFECAPLIVYVNGERVFGTKVSGSPKPLFNRPLESAGIPVNQPPF